MGNTSAITLSFLCIMVLAVAVGLFVCVSPFVALIIVVLPFLVVIPFKIPYNIKYSENAIRITWFAFFVFSLLWPKYIAFKFGGPDVTPSRLFQGICILFFVLSLYSNEVKAKIFNLINENKLIFFMFFSLCGLRLLSAIASQSTLMSLYSFFNEFLISFVMVFIGVLCLKTYPISKKLPAVMVVVLLVCIIAIDEYFTKRTIFSNFTLPGMKLDDQYLLQALSDKTRAGKYRAQGSFEHPLVLSEFLILFFPLCWLALKEIKGFSRNVFFSLILIIIPAGIFVSGSRAGAAIAFIEIIFILFLDYIISSLGVRRDSISKNTDITKCLVLISALIAGLLVAVITIQYFDVNTILGTSAKETESANARLTMLELGIPKILSSPIIGYGVSQSAIVLGFLADGSYTVDNFYLSYVLDSGFIALLFWLGIIAYSTMRAMMFYLKMPSRESYSYVLISLGLVFASIFKLIISIGYLNWIYLFLSILIVCRISNRRQENEVN